MMRELFIEDCCEILDSMRVPITASDREQGEYPYYGANGIQDHVANYIFDDELVLLAEDGGNFGSKSKPIAYRVSGKCWVNNHAHVLKPRAGLDIDYLCYSLMFYKVDGMVNGATRQKLTQAAMRKMKIHMRTMEEQTSIVNRLNHIVSIKKQIEKELQLYDDLIRARFVELFGDLASPSCSWERFHLVDACANSDDIKCGPFGTQLSKDEYTDTGIALWEIPQINSLFKTEPTHYLSVEKATKLSAYSIVTGDIAMSRKGNVGKCAVFPEEYPNGIIHSDVLRIRVDSSKVNPIFMMCQLHYSGAVTRQIELVSSGAIMAGINVTKLKQIYIHIPPLKLQKQFAYFYNQVNKSKLVEATTIIPKGGFLQWR
jgi:type I restriction enzyme S subunit